MSQSTSPHNQPLPPEIYRRRRIAAMVGLVVVLVVLALIIRAITGGGGSGTTAAASSTTAVSSVNTGSSSSAFGETSVRSTEESTEASAPVEPDAQCSMDGLQLAVRAGAPTYTAGQLPDFFLTVTNPTESDCTVDLTENPMRFEVFTLSDYTRVWADTDCNEPAYADKLVLAPGEARSFALNGWSRTTSSPGECGNRAPAGTGAFLLYGHIGDKTSEPETFNLA